MKDQLISLIHQANPWLKNPHLTILSDGYIPRLQAEKLLLPEWDDIWLVLVGPGSL
jgi:hypothetical protein